MSVQTLSHPDAANLPQERQSVACVSIHTPGPVQTRLPPHVASGHPLNAEGAGVCKPLRQSFHVIQAPSNQGKGLNPKRFRVVLVAVLNRPANYRQRSAKLGIGGFHVSSLAAAPRLGAFA